MPCRSRKLATCHMRCSPRPPSVFVQYEDITGGKLVRVHLSAVMRCECFFFAGPAQPSPRIHLLRTPLPQNFLRRSSGLLRVHAELLRTPRSSSEVILTRFTLKSPHLHQISPSPRVIRILRAWREVSRGLYTPNPAHTPRKNMRKLSKSEVTRGA